MCLHVEATEICPANRALHRDMHVFKFCTNTLYKHTLSLVCQHPEKAPHFPFVIYHVQCFAVLAEIPLRSPRKLSIFMIKKYIYRIKVSNNKLIYF